MRMVDRTVQRIEALYVTEHMQRFRHQNHVRLILRMILRHSLTGIHPRQKEAPLDRQVGH